MLISDESEIEKMENDPEDFVNLSLDTIDKQQSGIVKTAAAGLLEMLSDHIDGCTTFSSQMAIIMINYSVS